MNFLPFSQPYPTNSSEKCTTWREKKHSRLFPICDDHFITICFALLFREHPPIRQSFFFLLLLASSKQLSRLKLAASPPQTSAFPRHNMWVATRGSFPSPFLLDSFEASFYSITVLCISIYLILPHNFLWCFRFRVQLFVLPLGSIFHLLSRGVLGRNLLRGFFFAWKFLRLLDKHNFKFDYCFCLNPLVWSRFLFKKLITTYWRNPLHVKLIKTDFEEVKIIFNRFISFWNILQILQ